MGSHTNPNRAARILVVDDDPGALRIVKAFLTDAGHQVDLATGAEQALEKLARSSHDLAILDLHMPGMDGFELCARIRAVERDARLPILFLTAHYGGEEWSVRSRELGADDFVQKPISRRALQARVGALLRLSWGAAPCGSLAAGRSVLETVLESAAACLLALGPSGEVIDTAGRVEEILGVPLAAGAPLADTLPAEFLLNGELLRLVHAGEGRRLLSLAGLNGVRLLQATCRRLPGEIPAGRIGQLVVIEDQTQVRRAEDGSVVELGLEDFAAAAATAATIVEMRSSQALGHLRSLAEVGERLLQMAESLAAVAPDDGAQLPLASVRAAWRRTVLESARSVRAVQEAAQELSAALPPSG